MITSEMFASTLLKQGMNNSQERKVDSAMARNELFCGHPSYKRVYILDPDGWKWSDALFLRHLDYAVNGNDTDRYLEFRPRDKHHVGSYVFISDPDDALDDIGFSESDPIDPFSDPNFDMSKLWLIVGINDGATYPQYTILKCNWDYKWISKIGGKTVLLHSYGVLRTVNTYDSGVRTNTVTTAIDQVKSGWIPDTYYTYKDKIHDFNLCDTRYLDYGNRLMITTNVINPKVYKVSKIEDGAPLGIIKYTLKQDEYNETRDNAALMVCDYYNGSGSEQVEPEEPTKDPSEDVANIYQCEVDAYGEMQRTTSIEPLHIGKTSYFEAVFKGDNIHPKWKIDCLGDLSDSEKSYYIKLLSVNTVDETIISIKPGKANTLAGKKFKLTVTNEKGDSMCSIELEVDK